MNSGIDVEKLRNNVKLLELRLDIRILKLKRFGNSLIYKLEGSLKEKKYALCGRLAFDLLVSNAYIESHQHILKICKRLAEISNDSGNLSEQELSEVKTMYATLYYFNLCAGLLEARNVLHCTANAIPEGFQAIVSKEPSSFVDNEVYSRMSRNIRPVAEDLDKLIAQLAKTCGVEYHNEYLELANRGRINISFNNGSLGYREIEVFQELFRSKLEPIEFVNEYIGKLGLNEEYISPVSAGKVDLYDVPDFKLDGDETGIVETLGVLKKSKCSSSCALTLLGLNDLRY